MVKFFRQHQKWILLLMCVLMVVFGIQFARNPWTGGGDTREYAHFVLEKGKPAKLTFQEVLDSYSELVLLEQLSAESSRTDPAEDSRGPLFRDLSRYIYNNMDKETGGPAWALWVRLAEYDGLVATDADRKAFYSQYGLNDARVNAVRDKSSTTIAAIEKAINHWLVVRKMKDLAEAGQLQMPSYMIERIARNLTESTQVNVVRPDLNLFARAVSKVVTPEELRAQFRKYSDRNRGLDGSPVGYRIPDQVGVDVLGIDVLALVSDDDAKAYYTRNPERYMETAPASQPAARSASSQPTSQPATARRMRPLDADLMRRIKMTLATSRPDKPISATQPAKSPLDRAYDELLDAAKEIAETTKKTGYIPATDQGYLLAEARIKQDLHIKPFRVSTPAPFSEVDLQEELNKPTPESPAGQFGGTMRDIALLLTEGQPFRQAIQVVLAGQAVRNPAPATLAFQAAQPLVGDRKDTRPLPIGAQLAVVFAQGQGRLFIWRLSSARPSYVPDLGQVEGLVQGDVIRARAAEAAEKKLRAIAAAIAAPNGPTLDKTVESANADLAKQLPASQPAAAAASTQPAARPTTQPGTPATAPDGNSNLKFLTVVNRVDLHRQRLSIPPIDEEGIFRQAQGDMELYKQFHHLAELQSNWELLPGDPPAEVPSRQVVKSAFDLAGQYVRREGKPDKLLSVVNDPDTAVCALLQLVDVAEPGEQKLNGSIGRMEEMFQYRLESQFRQDWFDIFHRLEYVGPKKGQQGQQGDQGE